MRKTLAALAVSAAAFAAPAAADDAKASLLTLVGTGEPQTQLMAMVLTAAAVEQGATAQILLCGPAGDIALVDAPAAATAPQKPRDASPKGMLQMLVGKGVKVEVCAIYLPNKGVGPEALIDGVTPAKPPEVAAKILAENVKVMSF